MSAKHCTTHHYACDCREAMFAEMVEALRWIEKIADAEIKRDTALRANGARTLSQIANKAEMAIARATDQGEMK